MQSPGYISPMLPLYSFRYPTIIDPDNFVRAIADRLVAGLVVFAENGCLSIIGLVIANVHDDLAFGIENRATARDPSSFLTFVATRMKSSP